MNSLKKWWLGRENVLGLSISIAFSGIGVDIVLLDYGVKFDFSLPYVLNRFNPLNWVTHGLFRCILWLCGCQANTPIAAHCWWWIFSNHKASEIEVSTVDEILYMGYHWTVHTDHWGHGLALTIAGIECAINYRDGRHWDYDAQEPCENTR